MHKKADMIVMSTGQKVKRLRNMNELVSHKNILNSYDKAVMNGMDSADAIDLMILKFDITREEAISIIKPKKIAEEKDYLTFLNELKLLKGDYGIDKSYRAGRVLLNLTKTQRRITPKINENVVIVGTQELDFENEECAAAFYDIYIWN